MANEEHVLDYLTLTAEPGVIGGMPAGRLDFGAALNPHAVIEQSAQFDFYDGVGLDAAFLGLAQCDREGTVNVSRFGPRLPGVGGFIDISQNAQQLVFMGTFASRSRTRIEDGRLLVDDENAHPKFVPAVDQRSFSEPYAAARGQPVLYVTERCVFALTTDGLELTEIAPGVDLEGDVLARMSFAPIIRRQPKLMDARIFQPAIMGLKHDMLSVPLQNRFSYDEAENLFFLNLEGLSFTTAAQLEKTRAAIDERLAAIGHRVYAIVNYDNVYIAPDLMDQYSEAVRRTAERHYLGVTRYTTSSFMRLKLGHVLQSRDVAPHIHESRHEAALWRTSGHQGHDGVLVTVVRRTAFWPSSLVHRTPARVTRDDHGAELAQVTSAMAGHGWAGPSPLALPPGRAQARLMTTPQDITKLQAQIDDLHAQQVDLRKQLARAQLDQWQARVENLEVQMHLEAKQATDKAFALMDQLRAKWADARRQFEESISTASSVADTVRTGLEKACDDLRQALVESKDKLAAKNNPA